MQDQKKWNEMDAASGGKLAQQCAELREAAHALTGAEAKLIVLLRNGKSYPEIAEILRVQQDSLYTYSWRARKKLGLKNHEADGAISPPYDS